MLNKNIDDIQPEHLGHAWQCQINTAELSNLISQDRHGNGADDN
jgi:hypothetical protein